MMDKYVNAWDRIILQNPWKQENNAMYVITNIARRHSKLNNYTTTKPRYQSIEY